MANFFTESYAVLCRWTKEGKDLYYLSWKFDAITLQKNQTTNSKHVDLAVVRKEVWRIVHSINVVANVQSEMLKKE